MLIILTSCSYLLIYYNADKYYDFFHLLFKFS